MGAAQADIEVSYDVGNDFFAAWLDTRMVYSGAAFDGQDRTLEEAQRVKIDRLCDFAGVTPGSRVLEIGCGWGAALEHAVRVRGAASAHGLTLSRAQHRWVEAHASPGVTAEVADVREWQAPTRYDALLSVGMLEHLAGPAEAARGETRAALRAFFRTTAALARPGARFGLQTITRAQLPRDPAALRELSWATNTIFPNSLAPRIEEVIVSLAPEWELLRVDTARDDYWRTCLCWRERLAAAAPALEARYGRGRVEEYERYLDACILAFDRGYLSLCRFSLVSKEPSRAR